MLYFFLYPWSSEYPVFNIFKYITFRALGASITSLLLCLFLGPVVIRLLQRLQMGQTIREDGPKTHLLKAGTPTMGGVLILTSIWISTLLWADLSNIKIWIILGVLATFGILGWIDDYKKVVLKNPKGLSAKKKLMSQFLLALGFVGVLYLLRDTPLALKVPFFKDFSLDLDLFFIPFAVLVIVGASNAVNLTDGLDGLAIGPIMTTSMTFLILSYCAGHSKIAEYLQIPFVAGSSEIAVFLGAMTAAGLGFLWFNTYPAQVFMGDVGSLSLGAVLGMVSIMTKNEILLALVGGVFVAEAISVIAQVISFKTTGKRVFKMAPLHHHFELKGWPEPKVIVRFWIISILLALMALTTLKLQ